MITARIGDREAAEELANDVLMAVVLALREGRLRDEEKLSAFVRGTARNQANNYIQNRSAAPRPESLSEEWLSPLAPKDFERDEQVERLRREVDQLGTIDRQILLGTLLEGSKPSEMAGRLGVSAEVVRARKSRMIKRLIEKMKDNEGA
jgi:RNA polymerase sigma factor (sigma-70 family)